MARSFVIIILVNFEVHISCQVEAFNYKVLKKLWEKNFDLVYGKRFLQKKTHGHIKRPKVTKDREKGTLYVYIQRLTSKILC